ncbi:outer membrane lipoprotein chaperone LolA [Desulfovibrio sp. X2]|uniref:outer membrane lipoprotein chaperone LolA n=1 Tax=Desulfovibrio sp. X2 TaxID=941449 RepID=UPI00040537C6|nr:outer membrane lipoprotein chaperone LolA [Desulfovibrio sp. X2]
MRFALACCLLLAMAAPAGAASASAITADIQKQYESLKGFTADFKQMLKSAATGQVEEREGTISYKKPNLVRWETDTPEKELLLVGKKVVWNYVPSEKTASKSPLNAVFSSKTMIRFISGQANLDEDFVVEEQGTEAGLIKLALTPKKPEPNLVQAFLWVDPQSHMLRSVLIVDFYGNANKLGLDNIRINPGLSDSLFEFTPPKGVTVQDNTVSQ